MTDPIADLCGALTPYAPSDAAAADERAQQIASFSEWRCAILATGGKTSFIHRP